MRDYNVPADVGDADPIGDKPLSLSGQKAMQGDDHPLPNMPETPDDQPDAFNSQTATTELGDAMRAETGAEKPEVRNFHNIAPEGIYGEGRGGRG